MGCNKSQEPRATEEPTQELTWATPTTLEAGQSPRQPLGTQRPATPLIQEDADDDEIEIIQEDTDDEIELIQEGIPELAVRGGQGGGYQLAGGGHQGNAQEAPQDIWVQGAAREPLSPVPVRPLPRQQQEEAVKMAERRQRFENQRYQKGWNDCTSSTGATSSLGLIPQDGPRAAAYADVPHENPMLGLGLNGRGSDRSWDRQPASHGGIPGGVDDDVEEVLLKDPGMNASKHDAMTRELRRSTDFDDDDEALMREILEEDWGADQKPDPAMGWAAPSSVSSAA